METILNLQDMVNYLAERGVRKRIAVVCATDTSTRQSVAKAIRQGWAEAIFVGDIDGIKQCEELMELAEHISFVEATDTLEAAERAVQIVRSGEADVLMKGLISTDIVVRAILNKEKGILPPGHVLTHVAVAAIPNHPKLLFFTDSAVIPYPTQEQRFMQVKYITSLCRQFGISEPKVALIHCSEKVNAKHFPFTAGYAQLIEHSQQGSFGPCIVDGPIDLKVACNIDNMRTKQINSPLQGEADALVFPDIESGNLFYKSLTLFAHGQIAGILQGTQVPVVLPSRGDDAASKLNSLALACLNA